MNPFRFEWTKQHWSPSSPFGALTKVHNELADDHLILSADHESLLASHVNMGKRIEALENRVDCAKIQSQEVAGYLAASGRMETDVDSAIDSWRWEAMRALDENDRLTRLLKDVTEDRNALVDKLMEAKAALA